MRKNWRFDGAHRISRSGQQYAPTALFVNEIPKETIEQFGSISLSPEADQYDDEIDAPE